nr:hypothetical protein [Escherichia coli]
MNFIALWPLLLAQVTVMSLTVIFLAADRHFFSWDCFVVCTLSTIQDISQAYQKECISVCGSLSPQCFLVRE